MDPCSCMCQIYEIFSLWKHFFLIIDFIYLFIYLFMAVLGLRFCARAFSSCASGGHSSSRCAGLSLSRPLLLRSTGSKRAGSAIVAHEPSCSAACGIFPDQGSNPCPLHWQADSQPLRHQGSPKAFFFSCIIPWQSWVVARLQKLTLNLWIKKPRLREVKWLDLHS